MIEINPPRIQYPTVFKNDIDEIINSGQFVDGHLTEVCEKSIDAIIGREDPRSKTVLVNNGMGALELALMSYGIGSGDKVATTPYTFKATYQAIKRVGATPLFIDINNDLTMNYGQLMLAIDSDVAAIIPVDIFGIPNNISVLRDLIGIWPPYIIEDAAQAFGAEINGRRVGGQADTTIFSFYPTKMCGVGNVGATASQSYENAEDIRNLAHYGLKGEAIGGNYRTSEWDAAALSTNLIGLQMAMDRRREIAKMYKSNLNLNYTKVVDAIPDHVEPSWHHFPIWHSNKSLEKESFSFEIRKYYHDNFGVPDPEINYCFNFTRMVNNIYVIPVHENLTDFEVNTIIRELNGAL